MRDRSEARAACDPSLPLDDRIDDNFMTRTSGPTHVVVDGSNIATEGRSLPSLAQLNEAVLAFMGEHPDMTVTVVVDATFGHRIHKSEVKEFDSAVANNELVAPPAGAVGRGDAFVLGIADKANATILSNDSFQEFHGDYEWLFDEGRLVGGKPVPNVGWVFVPRVPVRGPISRKATRGSKSATSDDGSGRSRDGSSRRARGRSTGAVAAKASKEASQPMPVPKEPPPGRSATRRSANEGGTDRPVERPAPASSSSVVNELMPFLEFVEHHPVGTSVNAIVESYSSHGAYVSIGPVRGYVPLRLMADPPPRSAREAMKIGDAVTLVVADFAPARRSIDCSVPHMAAGMRPEDPGPVIDAAKHAPTDEQAPPKRAATKKAAAKKAGARKASATKKAAAKKAAAKKTAATNAPAKKAAATKAPAKKAATTKSAAKQPDHRPIEPPVDERPADVRSPVAKKAAAKKAAATKAPAKKSAAKKVAAKKAPAKKTSAKKAPARRRSGSTSSAGNSGS